MTISLIYTKIPPFLLNYTNNMIESTGTNLNIRGLETTEDESTLQSLTRNALQRYFSTDLNKLGDFDLIQRVGGSGDKVEAIFSEGKVSIRRSRAMITLTLIQSGIASIQTTEGNKGDMDGLFNLMESEAKTNLN